MRPSLGLLLAVALLAGCATPTLPGVSPLATRAMEPLGGLDFKPLTAANAPYMGGVPTAPGAGPMPAPAAMMPSPSPLASGGATSGNIFGGYYGYGYYGGGSTVPMALVSITEAEAPGSRGPLKRILEDVVNPVLADWAPDAHLVGSSGALGGDGLALIPSPAPSGQPGYPDYSAGWRLSYLSPSRQEALNFTVMADKTVAIRMRWAPLNLATAPIAVDADEAVKKLTAAIDSAEAKSEEEQTGLDYFLGTPFATPAPMGAPPPYQERIEPIYDVPEGARWNAQLQSVLGKLVWELNFHQPYVHPPQPMPMPMMTPSDHYVDTSGRGMVDAQTGAVIRFSRPSKRYFPQPFPSKPMPDMPSPIPLPVPSGTTAPSPTPPPAVAPSVAPSA